MKTKLVMGTVIIATSMLLSGCGADKPEDVATSFAEELSEANLKEAKSISTEDVKKKIKRLDTVCHKVTIENLRDESIKVLQTASIKAEDKKYESQAKKLMANFEKNMKGMEIQFEPEMKKIQKELIEKYGSMHKIPKEEKEKLMTTKVVPIFEKIFMPLMDDAFDTFDIKTENTDKVKKVFMNYVVNMLLANRNPSRINGSVLYKSAQPVILDANEPISPVCVAKYTDFGFIESINVIETITKSPDEVKVRLELIDKDDKSKKVSVSVEKIKNEWKVSRLPLDIW